MFIRMKYLVLIVAAVALVATGCGPKAAPPTSIMDSPEYHYKEGLKYLDKDQIDRAMVEFDRAIALEPENPLGYIGKGLALGKKGDFKAAFDSMEKAKDYQEKGIEANIGMIRLHSMQRAEGWLKEAVKEFEAANKKEPNNARLHYYMGMAYKVSFDFDRAAEMFKKILDMNKDYTAEANAEWAVIQEIQRAAPGTEIGKKIALIEKIDRADVAALFMTELDLEKLFTKRGVKTYDTAFKAPEETTTRFSPEKTVKMEAATDIADHWLRPSIEAALKLQIRGLEAGPNHKFEPDKLITKAEFALMLEDIMIKVSGNEKISTQHIGSASNIPDVRTDHYAFNAIMNAMIRGYLEADKATGEFRPEDNVSGSDALLSIRAFKDQLKF